MPFDWRSLNKNKDSRFKQKEEKNDLLLADNPYASDNFDSYNIDGELNGDKKHNT